MIKKVLMISLLTLTSCVSRKSIREAKSDLVDRLEQLDTDLKHACYDVSDRPVIDKDLIENVRYNINNSIVVLFQKEGPISKGTGNFILKALLEGGLILDKCRGVK